MISEGNIRRVLKFTGFRVPKIRPGCGRATEEGCGVIQTTWKSPMRMPGIQNLDTQTFSFFATTRKTAATDRDHYFIPKLSYSYLLLILIF